MSSYPFWFGHVQLVLLLHRIPIVMLHRRWLQTLDVLGRDGLEAVCDVETILVLDSILDVYIFALYV
jgi:hypothetical protein